MGSRRAVALAGAGLLSAAVLAGCGRDEPLEGVRALQIESAPIVVADARTEAPAPAAESRPQRSEEQDVAPAEQQAEVPRMVSRALGRANGGRLLNGVQLPAYGPRSGPAGPLWVTWDPIHDRVPNRPERRWATDTLIAFLTSVLRDYRAANPDAPPVLIGDLSRPRGGVFDRRFGGLGHASHQNGLDVDIYYPRRDRKLVGARRARQVDRALSQDLVDRFVAAGARFAFVGLNVGLTGPESVVQAIAHHDDHIHVRIPNPRATR